jgi:hypothetical protein
MNSSNTRHLYYRLRWWLGKYDMVYVLLHFSKQLGHLSVTNKTEVVIEGYPRSGNTFAEAAFLLAQKKGPPIIATHLHIPAQIKRAARMNKPCLIIFRQPIDAIASFLVYKGGDYPVRQAIREYIDFHNTAYQFRQHLLLASFDEVKSDFGNVMQQLNEKFACSFDEFEHSPENEKACFDLVQRRADEKYGEERDNKLRSAMPTSERTALKLQMQEELTSPPYRDSLQQSIDLYNKMEQLGKKVL